MLEIHELSIHFGGVTAINCLSFAFEAGRIHAVIGPNGAGKTTLFNLITGLNTPSSGEIRLKGKAIQGCSPDALARQGLARTFQNLQLCPNLSALENVMLGAHTHLDRNGFKAALAWPLLRRREAVLREEAAEWMRHVGLESYIDTPIQALSYGHARRLEIARALAMRPRLLFLDEPAAGLNPSETEAMRELIGSIHASGITVILVEHDMKLVMSLAQKILVLDHGQKLAEGSGEEIRRNPAVISAYLGGETAQEAEGRHREDGDEGRGKNSPALSVASFPNPAPCPSFQPASPVQARAPLLSVIRLESCYGPIRALHGIDLQVSTGELVALVGANGAGKSTLLRTLSGVQRASAGQIVFAGNDITHLRADLRVRQGICQSPEGRQIFPALSVRDNLLLGSWGTPRQYRSRERPRGSLSYRQNRERLAESLENIHQLFPVLREKHSLPAGTLSGGQQQMLAIGRALMGHPRLLLLDEPSMGLSPKLVEDVFAAIRILKTQGITILLVEQNARAALALADRAYVLETGTITLQGCGTDLLRDEAMRSAYLGGY